MILMLTFLYPANIPAVMGQIWQCCCHWAICHNSSKRQGISLSILHVQLIKYFTAFYRRYFKSLFLKEKCWIMMQISLQFVSTSPAYDMPVMVQTMAWRRTGDKPLYEAMGDLCEYDSVLIGLNINVNILIYPDIYTYTYIAFQSELSIREFWLHTFSSIKIDIVFSVTEQQI